VQRLYGNEKAEMTLDHIKTDQRVQILSIDGGWCVRQRLNQLGLFAGAQIRIKRGSAFGGPLVIEYNNSEIAIGRGMAAHINVKINDSTKSP
jgi:Fe2+ transport system protein FeoA